MKKVYLIIALFFLTFLVSFAAVGDILYVKNPLVNVREGAGMSYPTIEQLRIGYVVLEQGSEGNWTKVMLVGGKIGYIYSNLLGTYESSPYLIPGNMGTANINVYLREQADINSHIVGTLKKGDEVFVTHVNYSNYYWVSVKVSTGELAGYTGYIGKKTLDFFQNTNYENEIQKFIAENKGKNYVGTETQTSTASQVSTNSSTQTVTTSTTSSSDFMSTDSTDSGLNEKEKKIISILRKIKETDISKFTKFHVNLYLKRYDYPEIYNYLVTLFKSHATDLLIPSFTYELVDINSSTNSTQTGSTEVSGNQTPTVATEYSGIVTNNVIQITGTLPGGNTNSGSTSSGATESFTWYTGVYGSCSVDCGGGVKTREVYCQSVSSSEQVDDSNCLSVKPSVSVECNVNVCGAATWKDNLTQDQKDYILSIFKEETSDDANLDAFKQACIDDPEGMAFTFSLDTESDVTCDLTNEE